MATVEFAQATRIYSGMQRPALDRLDLEIADGEFLVLVGPSGCGKSTTLRMLAGLEPVDRGRIDIGERDVTMLPPRERDIAMVFQSYALYPHMTVAENIGFHLKIKKIPKPEIAQRVKEAADLLDLGEYLDRKPAKLSGGQRQRVAIARCLTLEPEVLVLDEAVSALDVSVQAQVLNLLKDLQDELGLAYVFISHDLAVVRFISDEVLVMKDGQVVEQASAEQILAAPREEYTKRLLAAIPRGYRATA